MIRNKIKIAGVGVALASVLSLVAPSVVMAWGPERPTYTMEAPADHAVFNSITNNSAIGDERDFVRIVENGVNETYTSDLDIEAGKQYKVYIYFHNDASETYNTLEYNQIGVAQNVRLASSFPSELAKGEKQPIIGKITSTTTDPKSVWDEARVRAKEALTLHYVTGSAKIYNHWHPDGKVLSTNLFSPEGTLLGADDLNGRVYGCDKFSGSVSYLIETKAVVNPDPDPDPEPEPTPDPEPEPEPTPDPLPTPEPTPDPTPSELPNTGPIEIGLAVVLLLVIVAGVAYWSKTRHQVSKATRKAKGKK